MIGRVTGVLVDRSSEGALIDVAGVGYEVLMSPRDLAELPMLGDEVVVHTHLYVREDNMSLYGFTDVGGRKLFRVLIAASGVGPKIALAMLATFGPDELRRAVLADDVGALTTVPGIGTRTAQKLILELRARLDLPEGDLPGSDSSLTSVRSALEGLGYGPGEIREAVAGLDTSKPVESILRSALQRLGQS